MGSSKEEPITFELDTFRFECEGEEDEEINGNRGSFPMDCLLLLSGNLTNLDRFVWIELEIFEKV